MHDEDGGPDAICRREVWRLGLLQLLRLWLQRLLLRRLLLLLSLLLQKQQLVLFPMAPDGQVLVQRVLFGIATEVRVLPGVAHEDVSTDTPDRRTVLRRQEPLSWRKPRLAVTRFLSDVCRGFERICQLEQEPGFHMRRALLLRLP